MIKRYTERKSARVLIIWIALLLLLSAYGTIVNALVPARSVLMLFGIVVSWLVTLWYAALLAFKLRAQEHWNEKPGTGLSREGGMAFNDCR